MIVALDLVFGPAIVWAVFAEAPTREGLVGGAVVLAAVIGHIVAGARGRPALAAEPDAATLVCARPTTGPDGATRSGDA